jgi:FkbM family methyltransferase
MVHYIENTLALLRRVFRFRTNILVVSPLEKYVDKKRLMKNCELTRLGTEYGGWIIPKNTLLTERSVCYLAGAGEDISFDCALVKRFGCVVRIIDPTPRAIKHFELLTEAVHSGRRFPVNNSNFDFYDITSHELKLISFLPIGLADKDGSLEFYLPKNPNHVSCSSVNLQKTEEHFTAQCQRLETIMSNMSDTHLDIVKMDIEGAEYSVISDMVYSKKLPELLLIEFDEVHTPLDSESEMRTKESIDLLLKAGMRCVAIEGCNATFIKDRSVK